MDAVGDCAGARQVIAVAGAVPVHRGEKDFTRAKAGEANGMFDSVNACGAAAAVGEDLPPAGPDRARIDRTHHALRSEEHTSELQSLMRISYAVFCLKKKIHHNTYT